MTIWLIHSIKKGFKMVDYRFATIDGVAVEQAPRLRYWASQAREVVQKVATILNKWDRKMQVFFEAQAVTRSPRERQVQWGFDLHTQI